MLIDRQAQFAFGKTPEHKITCPDEELNADGNKPNEAAMQQYIENILAENNWSRKLIQGAKDCFIAGRVALKLYVENGKCNVMFVPADGFVYDTDISDVDKLTRITFFYTLKDDEERERQRIWVQKYKIVDGRCFLSERITDGNGKTISEEVEPLENVDTGLNRIPATVIVNDGLSGDLDGESDVETIAKYDSWYNKMRSGNLDSLRKGMNQITYISGADPECMKHFRLAPGALWDVPPDMTAASENGTAPKITIGTISDNFNYADAYDATLSNIKQEMHNLIGVPDISLESMKSIVTSGKAMKAIYWPLIERCEEKMTAWKPALEWLTETLLYFAEVYPELKKAYGEFKPMKAIVTIDNQYPLPENEDEERVLDMQEVANKTRSIRSYLKKRGGEGHKGLSTWQAEEELQQIIEEQRMMEDSFEADMPTVEMESL